MTDLALILGAVLLAAAGGEAFLRAILGTALHLRVPKVVVATNHIRTSDPNGVFFRGDDHDLHGGGSKSSDLLLHTVSNASEHGGASRENDVAVKVLADINIALHDRVISERVNSGLFHSNEGRLEQDFRGSEPFISNGDDLSVGKFVRLLDFRALSGRRHFSVKVQSYVG